MNDHLTYHYVMQGIFALAGLTSAAAAIFNWDWFFDSRAASLVSNNAGRTRARLFYGLMGVILIVAAVCFYIKLQQL